MHGPINVKYPNNTSKWQMGFNSAFKRLIFISLLPFQPLYGPPAGIFHFGVPNMRVTCSTPPIILYITVQPICGADYKLWISLHACDYCSSPCCYYFLCFVQIFSSTPCTPTPSTFALFLTHSAVRDRLTVWPYRTSGCHNPITGGCMLFVHVRPCLGYFPQILLRPVIPAAEVRTVFIPHHSMGFRQRDRCS
jgi:hypothetical protein